MNPSDELANYLADMFQELDNLRRFKDLIITQHRYPSFEGDLQISITDWAWVCDEFEAYTETVLEPRLQANQDKTIPLRKDAR